jgi:hypothetical protein
LHLLLLRLRSQMLAQPQCLHVFLWRLCGHFASPFFTAPPPVPAPPTLSCPRHAPSTPSPRSAFPAMQFCHAFLPIKHLWGVFLNIASLIRKSALSLLRVHAPTTVCV